jgi:two-component system, cell cycle sensor histidine kinase and response regulator CckA
MRALFKDISIKNKLILIIMLVSGFALLVTSLSIFAHNRMSYRKDTIEELSGYAAMIGTNSTAAITFNDSDAAKEIISSISIQNEVSYACILNEDNKVFAEYRRSDMPDFSISTECLVKSFSFSSNHVDIVSSILMDKKKIGTVYLRAELDKLYARYKSDILLITAALIISSVAAFFLSSRLHRIISSPILYLADIAKKIASDKSYSVRAEKYDNRKDEAGQLIRGFNEMLIQIEQRNIELHEAHSVLETRVEQRTEQLQNTVKELEQSRHAALSIMEDAEYARKEAELERDRIEAMLKSIGDGVLVVDAKQRILLINSAAEKITGWSNREVVGEQAEKVFNIINEDTHEKAESPLIKVFAENSVVELAHNTTLVHRDGNLIPIADSGAPIHDKEGNMLGAILVFRDISDAKRIEKEKELLLSQLFQSQKMESIGVLAGGIAHDFNNLLQGILGYTSIIKSRLVEDDENLPHISLIEVAAERAAALTQQLLSFARKGKYDVVSISPEVMVNQVVSLVERTFDRNIEVVNIFDDGLYCIRGDKAQIHQALMNVFINARDAMSKGGKLTVNAQNIDIIEGIPEHPGLKSGKYVLFSIHDTGTGMSEDTMSKIFEPFFTTKELGKGTGLGLSLVFGVVKNHGGSIEVSSELGKGSTFKLYFPAEEPSIQKIQSATEPSETYTDKKMDDLLQTETGNYTVLVVDDEEIVNYVAQDMLKIAGYQTLSVSNGREAVKLYSSRSAEIDAILLDMIMPELGGLETFRELKRINPNVKVIVSSGYEEDERSQEIMKEGAITYLRKPFLMQKLLDAVQDALSRSEIADNKN